MFHSQPRDKAPSIVESTPTVSESPRPPSRNPEDYDTPAPQNNENINLNNTIPMHTSNNEVNQNPEPIDITNPDNDIFQTDDEPSEALEDTDNTLTPRVNKHTTDHFGVSIIHIHSNDVGTLDENRKFIE